MKKLVSISLYGTNKLYLDGAVANANLLHQYYPGWRLRIYTAKIPESTALELRRLGCELVDMSSSDIPGAYWRFFAGDDAEVDIVIVRDADSRFSYREAEAVDEWIRSGKTFHIMRDHPLHKTLIMAGMWGYRRPGPVKFRDSVEAFLKKTGKTTWSYGDDQSYLSWIVYPLIRNSVYVHDEYFWGKKFPHPKDNGFVGSSTSSPRAPHVRGLRSFLFNPSISPILGPAYWLGMIVRSWIRRKQYGLDL